MSEQPITLTGFLEWLSSAPRGTTLDAASVRDTLSRIAASPPAPVAPADAASQTWRERLWLVPAETRLGVVELVEAIGRPKSYVYRHTQPKATDAQRIPHRKLDGELVFVVGEIRAWIRDHEETIIAGRTDSALTLSRGNARAAS